MLISIKTKHANKIFEGTKIYEFRRKSIGEKNCNKKIFVYSSEEDRAIIGYMIVEKILEGDIDHLLDVTKYKDSLGIRKYFEGCNKCYALKISSAVRFKEPLYLSDIKKVDSKFVVPQFFRYIKEDEYIYDLLIKKR